MTGKPRVFQRSTNISIKLARRTLLRFRWDTSLLRNRQFIYPMLITLDTASILFSLLFPLFKFTDNCSISMCEFTISWVVDEREWFYRNIRYDNISFSKPTQNMDRVLASGWRVFFRSIFYSLPTRNIGTCVLHGSSLFFFVARPIVTSYGIDLYFSFLNYSQLRW